MIEIGGHAVRRCHRTQAYDIFVGAIIAHDADRFHRQQYGKGLPDVVILAGPPDFFDVDLIGEPQDVQFLFRDRAGAADRQSRPWKWMPADESLWQPKFTAEHSHLVLEKFA